MAVSNTQRKSEGRPKGTTKVSLGENRRAGGVLGYGENIREGEQIKEIILNQSLGTALHLV